MANTPEYIVIHHSATADGNVNDWSAIKKYHVETNGWRDIAYHWGIELIDGNVVLQKGRDESEEGAHTVEQSMNFKSIGICCVGNFDVTKPSDAVINKLVELIVDIYKRHGKALPIKMHREYATYKSCPGKLFPIEIVIAKVNQTWANIKSGDVTWKEALYGLSQLKLKNGDPVIGFPVQWESKLVGQLVDSESVRWLVKKTYRFMKENGL